MSNLVIALVMVLGILLAVGIGVMAEKDNSDGKLESMGLAKDKLIELKIHFLVNEQRELNDLKPLKYDNTLSEIAKQHSRDMFERNYLEHDSPEGLNHGDRLEQNGFSCTGSGENLFHLESSLFDRTADVLAEYTVKSWLKSQSHRQNMLDSGFEIEGIGVIQNNGDLMVTQLLCVK